MIKEYWFQFIVHVELHLVILSTFVFNQKLIIVIKRLIIAD